MVKRAPGVRLLRSLTRAAKTQQKTLVKLLDAYAKPAGKTPRKTPPPAASRAAPGRWRPGHSTAPAMPYWLYLPRQVPDTVARDGWPLVVMLHGCHQSAAQFAQGTRMNQLAEDKGYAVLYPEQLASAQAQRCWRWYDRTTQQGGGETAALAALIEDICARHRIDRRRIYACGLSAGAGMAAVLALNHPELIAAVGLHSGPVFGAGHTPVGALHVMRHGAAVQADVAIVELLQRRAMPAMPALLIQGEDDQVVRSINQTHLARQWLQLNGLPIDADPRVVAKPAGRAGSRHAHEIRDYLVGRKVRLRVVRIAGLRHAWSGGDPDLKFNAGPGPDASRMMLDFFGRHRR